MVRDPKTAASEAATAGAGSARSAVVVMNADPAVATAERKELQDIWKQVQEKVIQLTGGNAQKVNKELSIESVLALLTAAKSSDEKKADKYEKCRSAVDKTLQCVQTIGGIVATTVSNVLGGPSEVCFNAFAAVIQAWQDYEGMFENLEELVTRCSEFLERYIYYRSKLDNKLMRLACQNLQLFVEVCDCAIRLRRKHVRLMAFTRQLFLKDSRIDEILKMMDQLNKKETLLIGAQTFKIVSDSAGDIKLILDGQKEQKKDDEVKKWRRTIVRALGFPASAIGQDGEPIPYWQRSFDARKNNLVPDTGDWILTNANFMNWSGAVAPEKPILVLEGHNGSGRTSLLLNILRNLRKQSQNGPATSRAVFAYYISESDRRKRDGEGTSASQFLEVASRNCLWQLSTAFEAMTKSAAQIAERATDFDGSLDHWKQLFLDNKERLNAATTFFILIDGLDRDEDVHEVLPLLKSFSALTDGKTPRVLITTAPRITNDWFSQAEGLAFNVIRISDWNLDDVARYITHKMDGMATLKDPIRPGIAGWRDRILEELRSKCEGDFFKINLALNTLAKVDLVEDIEEVLADAAKTRSDQIDAEIRELNSSRTPKEIREINEMILWVDTGRWWFSVDDLEKLTAMKHRQTSSAALARRASSSTLDDNPSPPPIPGTQATLSVSLLPLRQKIAEKYPIFRVEESGVVDFRTPEVLERVPDLGDNNRGDTTASSTGPPVVQKAEVDIIRHFLRNVCPEDLYQRLEVDGFLDTKITNRQQDRIHRDTRNSHLRIAIACLVLLTDTELKLNTELHQYATYWLLEHLKGVDLVIADAELKAQAGPLLIRLLTEEGGIDAMFWATDIQASEVTYRANEYKYLREARCEWVYSMSGVTEVARWLKDPTVSSQIHGQPGQALVTSIATPSANLHEILLEHAAKHLAHHIFYGTLRSYRENRAAFYFLRGYLARLDPAKSSQMPNEAKDYLAENSEAGSKFEDPVITAEEVKQIESWAAATLKKAVEGSRLESQWEANMAINLMMVSAEQGIAGEVEPSMNPRVRAETALRLNPQNWVAVTVIGSLDDSSNEEVVELCSQAKAEIEEHMAKDPSWRENPAHSSLLARITWRLGDRLWRIGNDDELAAKTHRESLSYDVVGFDRYATTVQLYSGRKGSNFIMEFLNVLNETNSIWAPFFDDVIYGFLYAPGAEEMSSILAKAANETGKWTIVETFFALTTANLDASAEADNDKVRGFRFELQDAYARTLSEAASNMYGGKVIDKVISVRAEAISAARLRPITSLPREKIIRVRDWLARIYLERAFAPGTAQELLDSTGDLLAGLLEDDEDGTSYNIVATCSLIRYYTKRLMNENDLQRCLWTVKARVEIQRMLRMVIELLSDDDEDNDDHAFWILARLVTTLGDIGNTRICWNGRNRLSDQERAKWDGWVASQGLETFDSENVGDGDGSAIVANDDSDSKEEAVAEAAPTDVGIEDNNDTTSLPVLAVDDPSVPSSPLQTPSIKDTMTKGGLEVVTTHTELPELNTPEANTSDVELEPEEEPQLERDGTASETSSTSAALYPDPNQPSPPYRRIFCDGCGRQYFCVDVPLYTCMDCVGLTQFDEECYQLLQQDQLVLDKSILCLKHHEFILLPAWTPGAAEGIPKNSVLLPLKEGEERQAWVTIEEWKRQLREQYLPEV
ncbi:hypothetical protein OQA88_8000 [Cercophora sp. LCS_1]